MRCTHEERIDHERDTPSTHRQSTRDKHRLLVQHLRTQLPLQRLLEQRGLSAALRGRGPQRRGPCPVHAASGQGRTFSVHLEQNVFQCFDKHCGQKGDVIDLWACVQGLSLRDAALDLVRTFGLEPAPQGGTEKRNG